MASKNTIWRAPSDYLDGKEGDVLTVEFTVPCIGLNGGPQFQHSEAFSFQIATDDQLETDHTYGMQSSPMVARKARVAGARTGGGAMKKIDIAAREATRLG